MAHTLPWPARRRGPYAAVALRPPRPIHHCTHTLPWPKVWEHLIIQVFFFIFYYFLQYCRIIVKTSKLWNNTCSNSCSNQKSVKQIKIYFVFENLQIATLCLDDSFAHSWHSLNQLHLECFSNCLEGVPTYAEHLLAAFPSLCSPTCQTISIWLRSGDCGGQVIWCCTPSLSILVK